MDIILLFAKYVQWHYSRALGDILSIWGNFILFFYNFFSIELMTRTLFSKWRRMGEERTTTALDIGEILSNLIINTIMRIIGTIMRSIVIIIGLFCMLITLLLGGGFFIIWFFLPIGLLITVSAGVYLVLLK